MVSPQPTLIRLSRSQEKLYVFQKLFPENPCYNYTYCHRIDGDLNQGLLLDCLRRFTRDNEISGYRFCEVDGVPFQYFDAGHHEAAVQFLDWFQEGEEFDESLVLDRARSLNRTPLDLETGRVFQLLLIRTGESRYHLIVHIHHIVCDVYSYYALLNFVSEAYRAASALSPREPGVQLKDLMASEDEPHRPVDEVRGLVESFHEALSDPESRRPEPFSKPFDAKGSRHTVLLDGTLKKELEAFKVLAGTSTFSVLLSALFLVLSRYTGQKCLTMGIPLMGRLNRNHRRVFGSFVNLLPLTVEISGDLTFASLVESVSEKIFFLVRNQDFDIFAYPELVNDGGQGPFFSLSCTHYEDDFNFHLEGLQVQTTPVTSDYVAFPFLAVFKENQSDLDLILEYCSSQIEPGMVQRIGRSVGDVLRQGLAQPREKLATISVLDRTETEQLLRGFNATETDWPRSQTVVDWFEAAAGRYGPHTAVVTETGEITYEQLNRRANGIGARLRQEGAGRGSLVAICLDRGMDMVAGTLGILKSGAAYVPMDPDSPPDRLAFLLSDTGCRIVVTQTRYSDLFAKAPLIQVVCVDEPLAIALADDNLTHRPHPDDLVYVIYTSGTTGKPKGVMTEHGNLMNSVQFYHRLLRITPHDRMSQTASLSFDAMAGELWTVITSGAALVITPEEVRKDYRKLIEQVNRERLTIGFLPTVYADLLLRENTNPFHSALRCLVTSGERLNTNLRSSLPFQIYNLYGPTEDTISTTYYEMIPGGHPDLELPPIGRPMDNKQVYVLGPELELCPLGVVGELCIGGQGLARGYLDRPDLTASRFVDNPYAPGQKIYRSGDRGFWLADGNLAFVGRVDEQVKIRGYRIELGEVETALGTLPGVREALVVAREARSGEKELCAYLVGDDAFDVQKIRSSLREILPEFMVPAYFVPLAAIPLTSRGKVDKRRLPAPEVGLLRSAERVAPRTGTEQILVGIWKDVLGVPEVGIADRFFEVGGNSLKAIQMVSRVLAVMGTELSVRDVFTDDTIEKLALRVELSAAGPVSEIPVTEIADSYPASSAQKRMYVLHQIDHPDSLAYNTPNYLDLRGPLKAESVEQAIRTLVDRHESLRTSFEVLNGEIVQKVAPAVEMPFPRRAVGPIELPAACRDFVRPFDLGRSPLLRVELFQVAADHHVLCVDVHHIVSDGVSMALFLSELAALYRGESLPRAGLQYRDYAVWQNSQAYRDQVDKAKPFWQEQFADGIPILDFPTDHPRPAHKDFVGGGREFQLSASLTVTIRDFCQRSGITPFMFFFAAWAILLQKYARQAAVVIGVPVACRGHHQLQDVFGIFVNTLAIRTAPQERQTGAQYIEQVRELMVQAFAHETYPFEELVDQLGVPRDLGRNPLFDVMMVWQNIDGIDASRVDFGPVQAKTLVGELAAAKVDLSLVGMDLGESFHFSLQYATALFRGATVGRLERQFVCLVSDLACRSDASISDLELSDAQEKTTLLTKFNATKMDYPLDRTATGRFAEMVARHPDQVALVWGHESLTYCELDQRAEGWGASLRALGADRETPVAVMMHRGIDMVVAILAVVKTGAAYVPIDPESPPERTRFMLSDSAIRILLTEPGYQPREDVLPDGCRQVSLPSGEGVPGEKQSLPNTGNAHDLCYIIYTSGTTGQPKGVLIEHANLMNTVVFFERAYGFGPNDRITLNAGLGFDAMAGELWAGLLNGATVVITPDPVRQDLGKLVRFLSENKITIAFFPTIYMNILLRNQLPAFPPGFRILLTSGEKLVSGRGHHPPFRVVNMYGPTEDTIVSTAYELYTSGDCDEAVPPIGKPMGNKRVYILDEAQRLSPWGVVGELCLAGRGVARGYLNRPDLTAQKFITWGGEPETKVYRTGDLARWNDDGNLEFVGRVDSQVKVRGYRVEMGEIEAHLSAYPGILDARVLSRTRDGEQELSAYLVAEGPIDLAELRRHLESELPPYMIPAYFVPLESLPMTVNGKLDTRALPDPAEFRLTMPFRPAETAIEAELVRVWSEVLTLRSPLGIDENFFHIGGNSIRAIHMVALVHQRLGRELSIRDVFSHSTIRALALLLEQKDLDPYTGIEPSEPIPLTPASSAQKRMFMLKEIEGESAVTYNMPGFLDIQGPLAIPRLREAIATLVNRHESLRTGFRVVDGQVFQVISDQPGLDFQVVTLSEQEVDGFLKAYPVPFRLEDASLFRAVVVQWAPERYVFGFDVHHSVCDGVSISILLREMAALYRGETLPPLRLQYRDFATWQTREPYLQKLQKSRQYWNQVFAGEIPTLSLLTDHVRPVRQKYHGAEVTFHLDAGLCRTVETFCHQHGLTSFLFYLASWALLLRAWGGNEDVVIGVPVAGRGHRDLADLLGMFVNTLAIRISTRGQDSVQDCLRTIKENVLEAFDHEAYPFEALVEDLALPRDLSRNPLFDVMFAWQNLDGTDVTALDLGDVSVAKRDSGLRVAKFDLVLEGRDTEEGAEFGIQYATSLFESQTIVRMGRVFETLVGNIVAHPSGRINELDPLSSPDKEQILRQFNGNRVPFSDQQTLVDLFDTTVRRCPSRTAVIFGEQSLSFEALGRWADHWAGRLVSRGVKANERVGLFMDRSLEMVVGIVAILKAGGAYVPMDPTFPGERIRFLLRDSEAKFLLARRGGPVPELGDSRVEVLSIGGEPEFDEPGTLPGSTPEDLAYVIYTSGTTGQPKGVMVEHRSVVNFIEGQISFFGVDSDDSILQFSNYVFDASVEQIFMALTAGARLVLLPEPLVGDADGFAEYLNRWGVTHVHATPAVLRHWPLNDVRTLKRLVSGGERFEWEPWMADGTYRVFNKYGPTETTVTSVECEVSVPTSDQQTIPIGRPVPNTSLYVVRDGLLCPVGVPGELWIGGEGVARGYLNRPELTNEKFIADPFCPGGRVYRTGDLARWREDGQVECLGRMDDQVKIRGHRIELGEVQMRLSTLPGIQEARVLVWTAKDGSKSLCAYFVGTTGVPIDALRQHLAESLPDYMIPSFFVELEALPLTATGKLDRRRLPEPVVTTAPDFEPAETPEERVLAAVWKEILGIEAFPGLRDNFFHMGGDSIKAIQVTSRLKAHGYTLAVKDIFEARDIRSTALRMKPAHSTLPQERVEGPFSLTPIQAWFFDHWKGRLDHYNQSILLRLSRRIPLEHLHQAMASLLNHHDMLRASFPTRDSLGQGVLLPFVPTHDLIVDFNLAGESDETSALTERAEQLQRTLDLTRGPLVKVALFRGASVDRVAFIVHHLVIDGVSWRILIEDFFTALDQISRGQTVVLPPKTTSYKEWQQRQQSQALTLADGPEGKYWSEKLSSDYRAMELGTSALAHEGPGENSVWLDRNLSKALQTTCHMAYNTEINDLLLAALARALGMTFGRGQYLVDMEGHGREESIPGVELSRTVGWFTSLFPVALVDRGTESVGDVVKRTKEELRGIPARGTNFLALRRQAGSDSAVFARQQTLGFNYLGSMDHLANSGDFQFDSISLGAVVDPKGRLGHAVEVTGFLSEDRFCFRAHYRKENVSEAVVQGFLANFQIQLGEVADHCLNKGTQELTPSDVTSKKISSKDLNSILSKRVPK